MFILVAYILAIVPLFFFFFNHTPTTEIYTLSLHDALPICIELQGSLADINAINRTNEWAALDAKSDVIEIVTRIPTEWNPELVLSGLNDALRAHPEANCILAASDWAIDAVQAALEKVDKWYPTGKPKHMWIASCDLLT